MMNLLFLLPEFIVVFGLILLLGPKIRKLFRTHKNNTHFYVARDKNDELFLFRSETEFHHDSDKGISILPSYTRNLNLYGLNENDYANLRFEDEPVEVFLNLEN